MNQTKALPKQIIPVWLVSKVIGLIILLIICSVAWYVSQRFLPIITPYVLIVAVLALLLDIINIALVPYYYRFWRYEINADFVFIQSGFFIRQQRTIPINRIQNVDLEQGPLLQMAHLKELKVVTAADGFSISGITEAEADSLRNQIVKAARKAREENA
ncbi:PH domain-containing protein [Periweissella fabalis]|uniref:PH domain-containing protein n=1 Tax=Periweissella fabalis TaxID=1070421 RepID=A0A7X6N392_9LACO|nr:PH domain-containing protein [Periweissella fabalis]MCM0598842.1 PH domain-containing protein [Periweissella fabalis]NKZ24504.1 PH domain-containing protein [Periweissella fabalis]